MEKLKLIDKLIVEKLYIFKSGYTDIHCSLVHCMTSAVDWHIQSTYLLVCYNWVFCQTTKSTNLFLEIGIQISKSENYIIIIIIF